MKNPLLFSSLLSAIALITAGCFSTTASYRTQEPYHDYLYQYSVIDALLAGVYDGHLSLGELKQHGDFGIGTFNQLDGELLMLDSVVYRLGYDGSIVEAPDNENTPMAFVKFFKPERTIVMEGENLTYDDIVNRLKDELDGNSLYAVKIRAHYKTMQARSVKATQKPYPPLAAYTSGEGQRVFNFTDTTGVCIGFIMPPYVARINVPGMHLHYISDDHQQGGHVFSFTADRFEIEIDQAAGFIVQRNTDKAFSTADLHRDRREELHKVETH